MNIFKKKDKASPEASEKLLLKLEKMGYSKEMIKIALTKCPNPSKESAMLETLKLLSKDQIQIDANQKFMINVFKKYGDLGYDKEVIKVALSRCSNIYNENSMLDALNTVNKEMNMVNQNFINNVFKKYGELGYSTGVINVALNRCPNIYNENAMIDTLNIINREMNYPPRGSLRDDENLNHVILESIETARRDNKTYESQNPLERRRKNGVPVGLKNIGNTCYFNSLLQTYFMNHKFVKEILDFVEDKQKTENSNISKRVQASIALIKNLQSLFAYMIKSDKKYVDPSQVLNSVVDDEGNSIPIGDQKDVAEFNLCFLSRIEEGLQYKILNEDGDIPTEKKDEINENCLRISEKHSNDLSDSKVSLKTPLKENKIKFSYNSIKEESVICQTFFGKMQQTILYTENNEKIEKTTIERFNMIILDVAHKDLYSAWEYTLAESLEDFKNEIGEVTHAFKRNTLIRVPTILFYQIQRVKYELEKGPKKLNDAFKFEKEIYLDRFMDCNYALYRNIQDQVLNLRQQYQKIQDDLRKFEYFDESNMSIQTIFGKFEKFLNMQRNKTGSYDPLYFGIHNQQEAITTTNLLFTYKTFVDKRFNDLKNSLKKINEEIEKCYNAFKKNFKYNLLGILMHDGQADSGHYFVYIYDFEKNIWRKYNDQLISEESEENVLKEAYGDEISAKNAYCLIYARDTFFKITTTFPYRSFLTSENSQIETDIYSSYLEGSPLLLEINRDNLKFAEEIEESYSGNLAQKIVDEYNSKYNFVLNLIKIYNKPNFSAEFKPPNLSNFYIFLKYHPSHNDYSEYIKVHLFNKCLKEFHPNKISLKDLKDTNVIFQEKLQKKINNLSTMNRPDLNLISGDCDQLLNDYINQIRNMEIMNYIFEKSLDEHFEEAYYAVDILLESNKTDFFFKIAKDFFRIQTLRVCSFIITLVSQGKSGEAIYLIGVLLHYTIKNLSSDEIVAYQIQIFFSEIIDHLNLVKSENKEVISEINDSVNNFQISERFMPFIKLEEPKDFHKRVTEIAQKYHPDIMIFNKTDNSIMLKLSDNFHRFENEFWPYCNLYKELLIKKTPYLISDLKEAGLI